MYDAFMNQLPDIDPDETQEWIEALDQVIDRRRPGRARFLMHRVLHHARSRQHRAARHGLHRLHQHHLAGAGAILPRRRGHRAADPAYHPLERGGDGAPGEQGYDGIGGHLSTYASAALLYEVGFNHFFTGHGADGGGDLIFFQGHAAPGIYARASSRAGSPSSKLDNFRREASVRGLSSYPHPRLMPEYWEFPTVSMGLSPLNAIYQARFNRYLQHRGIKDTSPAAGLVPSSATARWTSPSRWRRSRWLHARVSTT